jgi:hypothetical protein
MLRGKCRRRGFVFIFISIFGLLLLCLVAAAGWSGPCLAQDSSDGNTRSGAGESIGGIVINSVTREPIARALVYSPDARFATLTNSEGRFEFSLPKIEPAVEGSSDFSPEDASGAAAPIAANRPFALAVRKPGFMPDPSNHGQNLQGEAGRDVTLGLIPESLIVGNVSLPTSEAPDTIGLQLFRREVQNGQGHWVSAGDTQSRSDGQFRFAELSAGTYKMLTLELLDRDPLSTDPRNEDPFAADARGPLFGYPPVYYQNATDFGSASTIQLSAGQTVQANLSLARQAYYRVKVPVVEQESGAPENVVAVNVYANGRKGPGFVLGYNNAHHAIEGMLPNGTYTVEASTFGPAGASGMQTITVKGARVDGPTLALVTNGSIAINVKEEFTVNDPANLDPANLRSTIVNGRALLLKGPSRYLNVTLERADYSDRGQLIYPSGQQGAALVIDAVPPGTYWVQVNSARGYAASIRSGNVDLQHQPLVVGVGGGVSPIEITMRDDMADIRGTVEGITQTAPGVGNSGAVESSYPSPSPNLSRNPYLNVRQVVGVVYFIPTTESAGKFAEIGINPDGSFDSSDMAPGAYRLLAFDREQPELEYRDAEAMRPFDSKGPVVRVASGQSEHVTLHLISNNKLEN